MKVVIPTIVTDDVLTASNIIEDDFAQWEPGIAYAKGARVLRNDAHKIFESVIDDNLNHDPAGTSGRWLDAGATSRWAMFDDAVGSATTGTGTIQVTLAAPAGINALSVLDTNAASVRVQLIIAGATIYDVTQDPELTEDASGSLLLLDLPGDEAGTLIVTLMANVPGEAIEAGTLIMGTIADLGITEAGPSVGINDFSRRETDDFGVTKIVERAWSKRMTVRSMISSDAVDDVQRGLADLRATPVLWIGEEAYDSLIIYGFFKDFSIDLAFETISYCSLTIEGLTKAAPLTRAITAFSAFLTNENHFVPADGDGNVTSYAGAEGSFSIYAGLEDVSDQFELTTADNPLGLVVTYAGRTYAVTGGLDAGEASASLLIRATGTGAYSGLQVDKTFSIAKSIGGADGLNAKTLRLSADRQIISYNSDGAAAPAVQTISFNTSKQNSTATVNWSLTDANGIARAPVTDFLSAATGSSVTMTAAQFEAARNSTNGVIVTASISDGGVIFDRISIVKVQEGPKGDTGPQGPAAISFLFSNAAHVLQASTAGVVGSYEGSGSTLQVLEGSTALTFHTVLAPGRFTVGTPVINPAGGITVGTRSGYGTDTCTIADHAAMSGSVNSLTIMFPIVARRADGTDVAFNIVQSLVKSKAGADGLSGAATPSIQMTRKAVMVWAYANGGVVSWADANGLLRVMTGETDATSFATLSATPGPGVTGTINTAANTPVPGQPKGYYRVTGMTGDTGTLTLTAILGSVTLTEEFSIAKSRGGYEIVASLPTTDLFKGRIVFLTTDDKLYRYTGSEWTKAVDGADLMADSVTTNALGAGVVTAAEINVTELSAITSVIGLLRTATVGQRTEFSNAGVQGFYPSGNNSFQLGDF